MARKQPGQLFFCFFLVLNLFYSLQERSNGLQEGSNGGGGEPHNMHMQSFKIMNTALSLLASFIFFNKDKFVNY